MKGAIGFATLFAELLSACGQVQDLGDTHSDSVSAVRGAPERSIR